MGKVRTTGSAWKMLENVGIVVADPFVLGQNHLAASNFFFPTEVFSGDASLHTRHIADWANVFHEYTLRVLSLTFFRRSHISASMNLDALRAEQMILVRLTKKLAAVMDGIDVSSRRVGDLLELPDIAARMLIAEGWAELALDPSLSSLPHPPTA